MLRNTLILGVGVLAPFCLTGVWVYAGDHAASSAPALPSCCAEKAAEAAPLDVVNASAEVPAQAGAMGDASVKGIVKFEGAAPAREAIDMKTDAVCAKAHAEPVLKEDLIVGKDGGMRNVFVYVKKGIDGKFEAPKEAAKLDQHGCAYVPHVFGIVVGQKITVHNSDGTTHNVHTFGKKNKPINQAQPAGSKELEIEWKTAEMGVPIKCDMHPWMSAVCFVVKHPFFAVTDERGAFEIKNLPAGDYTIEAVHETLGAQTMELKVAAKESKDANFTFKK